MRLHVAFLSVLGGLLVAATPVDFVAGHTELAQATGAKGMVNQATGVGFAHEPVGDGDTLAFGRVTCVVLTTPATWRRG